MPSLLPGAGCEAGDPFPGLLEPSAAEAHSVGQWLVCVCAWLIDPKCSGCLLRSLHGSHHHADDNTGHCGPLPRLTSLATNRRMTARHCSCKGILSLPCLPCLVGGGPPPCQRLIDHTPLPQTSGWTRISSAEPWRVLSGLETSLHCRAIPHIVLDSLALQLNRVVGC